MPLIESIQRRSESRSAGQDQVQNRAKSRSTDFDLSKAFFIARHIPCGGESRFKYIKLQGDRMVHAMLDAHVNHCLQRMVLSAIESYDDSVKELTGEEETERFVLHLLSRKVTLVNEQMLGAFSELLREEHLKYPHGTKELAEYIVRCFNEEAPLTKKVMAVERSGEVVIVLAEDQKSDASTKLQF